MSHVPMEYWLPGSVLLTVATLVALDALPLGPIPDYVLIGVFVGYVVLWAYSPLPQGPPAPGHKHRKRVWGFTVEHEDGPQKQLGDFRSETNEGETE